MKWMFLKLSSLYLHNACFPLCSLLHCAVVMVSKSCTSLRRMVFCALTVVVWRVFLMTPFVAQKPKVGLLLMLTSRNVLYIVCSLLFTINASTEILFFFPFLVHLGKYIYFVIAALKEHLLLNIMFICGHNLTISIMIYNTMNTLLYLHKL